MKQEILKNLNIVLAILLLSQLLSGIFRKEIGRGLFELIHEKGVISLIIVLLINVVLNRGWIKKQLFQ